MTQIGSPSHEQALQEKIKEHEKLGHVMLDLNGKSPDAIGAYLENGKIKLIAIDVVSSTRKKKTSQQQYFLKLKQELYESLGFDKVIVYEYHKYNQLNSKRSVSTPKKFKKETYKE